MPELKIGVVLRSFRQPFRTALRTANELGIPAIEVDARHEVRPGEMSQTAIRQLRKLLDDLRLRVCAVSFYTRRGYGVLDQLDRRVEATRQAMQLAYALSTPIVVNQVGRVPDQSEGPEWELLVDVLRDLGDFGQRTGAMLCAETGSESGADLARLVQALPDGALGVSFNPGNLVVNGFSVLEAAEQLGPYVQHVHVKDAVHDLARGRGVEVEIGRGSVDFPSLLGVLEEHDFRGTYAIEREGGAEPVQEVQRAIRFLKGL